MRILVVQTNVYRYLSPSPIGASLVASRLRRDGHDVRFVDLMFERDPEKTAARAAREHGPDLACFSIRNRDNMDPVRYVDPIPGVAGVVGAVRGAVAAPALIGGTAVTTFPARLLEATGADWALCGDDLDVVSRFVRSVGEGTPDPGTPGLVRRDGGAWVENPFRIAGYRDVVFDNWDLVDLRRYRHGYWQAAVVTRSGCPEECSYCDTFHSFGRELSLRDPEAVADDMLRLKRAGVRSVFLVDAGFNRPRDHAKAVLRALLRRGAQLQLNAILDPFDVDDELLALYRRAGGVMVALFAESLSDEVLEAIRKPFRAEHVRATCAMLRRAGVAFLFMPTLGGPGETPETASRTLDGAPSLGAAMTQISIGWRIQPRTALHARAVAEGVIDAGDDGYEARFYVSPATPRAWLEGQVRRHRLRLLASNLRMVPYVLRALRERPHAWGPDPVAAERAA